MNMRSALFEQQPVSPVRKPLRMYESAFDHRVHQHFKRLRQEEPVALAYLGRRQKVYLITRYDDCVSALKDDRLIKNMNTLKAEGAKSLPWLPKTLEPLMHNMLNMDEPDHRRLRNLVHKAFTPKMISGLAGRIEQIANELLDRAITRGQVDLIEAYALPLPITVIAEMVGIPKTDYGRFRRMVERIIVSPTPLNMARAVPTVWQLLRYFRKLVAQRRHAPQDDLLTALVQADDEGERLSEDELIGMVFLLLVAGHETTVNLISNGTLALLNHPEQLAMWQNNPDIAETAVEELLRFDGPLMTTELSFARHDMTLHGVTIPQGSTVLPALISANRDGTIFKKPDELDLTRSPNRHLAFGHGIHYCLGAPLARLEGRIAFNTLLERAPNLGLTVEPAQLDYKRIMILRGLKTLPVSLS